MKKRNLLKSVLSLLLCGCLSAAALPTQISASKAAAEADIDTSSVFESHFTDGAGVWNIDPATDYVKDGILYVNSNNAEKSRTMTHSVTAAKAYTLEIRMRVTSEGTEQGFKFETNGHRMLVRVGKQYIKFETADSSVLLDTLEPGEFNTFRFEMNGNFGVLYINGKASASFRPAEWDRHVGISIYCRSLDKYQHASMEIDYIKYSHPYDKISITSPMDGADFTEGGKIYLKAKAEDDIPYVDYYANGTFIGRAVKDDSYKLEWRDLRVGQYIISAVYGDSRSIESTITVSPKTGTIITEADKTEVKLGETVKLSINRTPINIKKVTYFINGKEYESDNGILSYKADTVGKLFISAVLYGNDFSVEYAVPTEISVSTDKAEGITLQSSYTVDYSPSANGSIKASDGIYALEISHNDKEFIYLTADGSKTYPLGLGNYRLVTDGGVCDLYYNGQFALSFILPVTDKANGISVSAVSDLNISGINATVYTGSDSSGKAVILPDFGADYALEFTLDEPKDFAIIAADGAYAAELISYNGSLVAVSDRNGTYNDGGEDLVRVGTSATANVYTDAENVTLCTLPSGRHAYRITVSNGICQLFIDNKWEASFRLPSVYSVPYLQTSGITPVYIRQTEDIYTFSDSFDGSAEFPSSEYYNIGENLEAKFENGAMILSPNLSATEQTKGFTTEFDEVDKRFTTPDKVSFDGGIMKIYTANSESAQTYGANTDTCNDYELEAKIRVTSFGKENGFKYEYGSNRVMVYFNKDKITVNTKDANASYSVDTTAWHVYKFAVTDGGNCEVFIDGVSVGKIRLQERSFQQARISVFIKANAETEAAMEIDHIRLTSFDKVEADDTVKLSPATLKVFAFTPYISTTVRIDSAEKGSFYLSARYNNEYRNILAGYNFTEGRWEIVQTHPTPIVLTHLEEDFPFGTDVKLELEIGEKSAVLYVNGQPKLSNSRISIDYYGNVGIVTGGITANVLDFAYKGTGRVLPGTVTNVSSVSSPEIFEYEDGVIYSIASGSKALISADDGYTWESVSPGKYSSITTRLSNGTIVYAVRKDANGGYIDYTYVSTDNGVSFEGPYPIQSYVRNRVTMNNKFTEGSDGRLYYASGESGHGVEDEGGIRVFYSDDSGRTWKGSNLLGLDGKLYTNDDEARIDAENSGINCQESRVVELPDGTLRLYCRTDNGFLYYSVSTDRGETFSAMMYPSEFISVLSAFNIERDPYTGYYYCAWEYNNKNDSATLQHPRTRTGLAVSYDGMETWEYAGDIHETRASVTSTHANIGIKPTKNAVYVTTVYHNDINAKGDTVGVGYLVRVDKDTMKTTERFTKVHTLNPNEPNASTASAINSMLMINTDYSVVYAGGKLYIIDDAVKGYIPAAIAASAIGATVTEANGTAAYKLVKSEAIITAGSTTVKIDGKSVTLSSAPIVKNGIMFIPVDAMSALWSREITSLSNGSTLFHYDPYGIVPASVVSAYLPTARLSLSGAINNVPSTWAQAEVFAADNVQIIPSALRSSYREKITREEFCELIMKMLCKVNTVSDAKALLDKKNIKFEDNFTDTDNENVIAANLLGILNGRGNGIFDPDSGITRQEAAVMLANTAKLLGVKIGTAPTFKDSDKMASWAADAIKTVTAIECSYGSKVMGGVGNNMFDPLGAYTREQSILTVYRLFMS